MHVTPPMSAPDVLTSCKNLVTETGFVDVSQDTLQHTKFNNVFAIGDCSSSPNSKTAASAGKKFTPECHLDNTYSKPFF